MASEVLLEPQSVLPPVAALHDGSAPGTSTPTKPVDNVVPPQRRRAPTIPQPPPPKAPASDPMKELRRDTPVAHIDPPRPPPPPYSDGGDQIVQNVDDVNARSKGRVDFVDIENRPPSPRFVLSARGDLVRRLKRTVALRDKVAGKRIGLEVQEGHYRAQWKHTSKHLDDFIDAATRYMASIPADLLPEQGNELRELWERLQQSSIKLNKWQNDGLTDVYTLTKLEGTLTVKEEQLYDELRLAVQRPNMDSIDNFEESGSVSTINFGGVSEPSMDPLEAEYYDKVGDLHLLSEYIFNVDADHNRRIRQREEAFQAGTAAFLPPERHSFEKYIADRKELIAEFFEKKKEMEHLRKECLERGFNVQEIDWPSFNLSRNNEGRPRSTHHDMGSDEGRGGVNFETRARVSTSELLSRVIDWRDDVLRESSEQDKPRAKSRPRPQKGVVRRHFPLLSLSTGPGVLTYQPFNTSYRLPPLAEPVPEDPSDAVDEASITFGKFQQDDLPGRRYSEPNLSEVLRLLNIPSRSPKQHIPARSEGDIDALSSLADTQDQLHSQNWLVPTSETRDTDS